MSENKTGKPALSVGRYLKYAIGEIILVVIGILIALQINNWNTDRLNTQVELNYLKGLASNLSNDINELEVHLKTDTLKLNAYTRLIDAVLNTTINGEDAELVTNLYAIQRPNWFEGNNVVFEDLKSSGKLHLISSERIKTDIQIYYRFFVEVVKREDIGNSTVANYSSKLNNMVPYSAYAEPIYPDYWRVNTVPPDVKFLLTADLDMLANGLSVMKANQYFNHQSRFELYQKAINLRKVIENYLVKAKK